jgi:NAD(P)-dependent dehydrogenase (short-subunit alcohol dehydrogenase family)
MPPAPFRGLAVIVTGAPSGIGRAMAGRLAARGTWLARAARSAGELDEPAVACLTAGAAVGARAVAVPADVAVGAECRAIARGR